MRDQELKETGPGRPREFDEDDVLSKITDVFWNQGYEGTGLSDIMKATGLKKGSLYAAFGNKQSMYHKAIQYYEQDVVAKGCAMLRGEGDPAERLTMFLNMPIVDAHDAQDFRGCFLCNAATEQAPDDPGAASLIAQGFDRLENALTYLMSEMHPENAAKDTRSIAQTLITLYAGLRVMGRAGATRERMESARDSGLKLAGAQN